MALPNPGFQYCVFLAKPWNGTWFFPFSSLSTWGPHGVASCKLGDSVRKAWSTWHSQSLPRTSKSRSILSVWTWHITVQHSFRHSSRHELIEATSLKCTHRTISNYLELCSNYVAGSVFFSKKWSSVSQDWPCFEGPASAIRKGEWEVARNQKKVGLPSAGPRPFTRTLEKPRRDMLNKRELVKLDVEVARLKARFGQTDGLLGTLLIANPFDILSLHGPMISKSEMRKIHRVSVMYCYFIFLISFRLGQPREQLTLCYLIQ